MLPPPPPARASTPMMLRPSQPMFDTPRGSSVDVKPYDMTAAKQRDALVGRIVWILIFAIAAGVGVLFALFSRR
jgi:hypothetical protein